MIGPKTLLLHVDVDSPRKLLHYYGADPNSFSEAQLVKFYETAMGRALAFFESEGCSASFFVVGDELRDVSIQRVIRRAHDAGHEIANHTFTHPLGLAKAPLDAMRREIEKCSEAIKAITGKMPAGFRSPGYSVNAQLIDQLRSLGFKYDSSAFWSVLNPLLRAKNSVLFRGGLAHLGFGSVSGKLPLDPYQPAKKDWMTSGAGNGGFWELPLPRLNFALPYYNNFNLWAPALYGKLASRMIRSRCVVYLFHVIEFVDMTDALPAAISSHPNVKMPVAKKIERTRKIIRDLKKNFHPASTLQYVDALSTR